MKYININNVFNNRVKSNMNVVLSTEKCINSKLIIELSDLYVHLQKRKKSSIINSDINKLEETLNGDISTKEFPINRCISFRSIIFYSSHFYDWKITYKIINIINILYIKRLFYKVFIQESIINYMINFDVYTNDTLARIIDKLDIHKKNIIDNEGYSLIHNSILYKRDNNVILKLIEKIPEYLFSEDKDGESSLDYLIEFNFSYKLLVDILKSFNFSKNKLENISRFIWIVMLKANDELILYIIDNFNEICDGDIDIHGKGNLLNLACYLNKSEHIILRLLKINPSMASSLITNTSTHNFPIKNLINNKYSDLMILAMIDICHESVLCKEDIEDNEDNYLLLYSDDCIDKVSWNVFGIIFDIIMNDIVAETEEEKIYNMLGLILCNNSIKDRYFVYIIQNYTLVLKDTYGHNILYRALEQSQVDNRKIVTLINHNRLFMDNLINYKTINHFYEEDYDDDIEHNYVVILALLRKNNLNINIISYIFNKTLNKDKIVLNNGNTLFHIVINRTINSYYIYPSLLYFTNDILKYNNYGETPLDLALNSKQYKVATYLKDLKFMKENMRLKSRGRLLQLGIKYYWSYQTHIIVRPILKLRILSVYLSIYSSINRNIMPFIPYELYSYILEFILRIDLFENNYDPKSEKIAQLEHKSIINSIN